MSAINSTTTKLTASKEELKKALAKMLTNIINSKKWSDKDAAEELGVKQSKVTSISKGALNNVSLDNLLDIFVKFGYKSELKLSSNQELANLILTKKNI